MVRLCCIVRTDIHTHTHTYSRARASGVCARSAHSTRANIYVLGFVGAFGPPLILAAPRSGVIHTPKTHYVRYPT